MEKHCLNPAEITAAYVEAGYKKANLPVYKMLLLGVLAGAFIAFAAEGSNVAIHTIASVGLAKALAGALFATGLMMVIITGAELFTGNTLMVVTGLHKRTAWGKVLKNWFFVYLGNFIGSLIVVFCILYSGQFNFTDGMLGGFTIKQAVYKTGLSFSEAFFMGVLCNWLVCMAIWMALAARDIAGKILAIFFPIWLFITSGFEHSVANMYYIPAGIFAKANPVWVKEALALGVLPEKLAQLDWSTFIIHNLVPVTLGNIVGGSLFVGMFYWLSFLYQDRSESKQKLENDQEQGGIFNS